MTCHVMPSLGVYVLSAAGAAERRAVEEHLPGCAACREELARLAPLPGLLSRVAADAVPAGLPGVPAGRPGLPDRASALPQGGSPPRPASPRRARRWRIAVVTAASAVAGVAAGFAAATATATPGGGGGVAAGPVVTFAGADPATHVRGTAALTSTTWGSRIDLRLHGRLLGTRCELVVDSRAGSKEVVGTWNAWGAENVVIPASTAWRPSEIASLQVQAPAGDLVTMTPAVAGSPPRAGQ